MAKFKQHLLKIQDEHEEEVEELRSKLQEEKEKSLALQDTLDQYLREKELAQTSKIQEAETQKIHNLQGMLPWWNSDVVVMIDQIVYEHQEEMEVKTFQLQCVHTTCCLTGTGKKYLL